MLLFLLHIGVELPSKCGGNGNDDGGGEVSDSSGSVS